MNTLKLCKDCKWNTAERCIAPQNLQPPSKIDLVSGAVSPSEYKYKMCATHRSESLFWACIMGLCGKSARWFTPKDSTHA